MIPVQKGEALIHDAAEGHWLYFRNPLAVYSTTVHSEIPSLIRDIHKRVCSERLYAAGCISYDASPGFDKALPASQELRTPLLLFSLYKAPEIIKELHFESSEKDNKELKWTPCISKDEYNKGFSAVKEYIRTGHSYQVNYTYRLEAEFNGEPRDLFCRMQKAQNASYGAYLDYGDLVVASASPELFFSLNGDRIMTKPMKGTAPRGMTSKEDKKNAQELYNSEKNRAENMMIVDMIRNDLGRIARSGTVRVPRLFEIEKYPTLWQMTTEVFAETDAEIPVILENLFPCASITGAPKYRTMEIIKELESTARGLYTGSVGYWGPHRRAQFNVAIRTALINRSEKTARYGTGGGVVWDSTMEGEYEESLTKTGILSRKERVFSLLETLKWTKEDGFILLERHLKRLEESADYFDYPCTAGDIEKALKKTSESFRDEEAQRVRLLLDKDGEIHIETQPLNEQDSKGLRTLKRADHPINSRNPFLFHKTTEREIYKNFLKENPDYDDVLLWNEQGEITESCIANIVLVLKGIHYTPPVSCGLLAGTMRQEMLEQGVLKERVVKAAEIAEADEIYLINSVRGIIRVNYSE